MSEHNIVNSFKCMHVTFPGGIIHFDVNIHYNYHTIYLACYRRLPFMRQHELTGTIVPCVRRRKEEHFEDAVTQSIMETYPVIGDVIGTVVSSHRMGTLSDISKWKIRWHPTDGNSVMVDTQTWEHVRMGRLIDTSSVGKHTKRFFETNFMGYIFTDPEILRKVHEQVLKLPDYQSLKILWKSVSECPDDTLSSSMDPMALMDLVRRRLTSVNDCKNSVRSAPAWSSIDISGHDVISKMVDEFVVYSNNVRKILRHKLAQCFSEEEAFEYMEGIEIMNDFSYKVPYDKFDVRHGVIVKKTMSHTYVSTGVSRRCMREYFQEIEKLTFPYDPDRDYGTVREFMDSVNDQMMHFAVLGSLYLVSNVCRDGSVAKISDMKTHIIDQYSIRMMVEDDRKVIKSSFEGYPGVPTVVSGMMSSGKTSYLLSVGLCQLIFQFGCPRIPAADGSVLYVHGVISVIKNHSDDMFRSRSTFQSHLLSVSSALHSRDYQLLILDEPFSSTRFSDARRLLAGTINSFCTTRRSGILLVSTHLEISNDTDVQYLEADDYTIQKTSRRKSSTTLGKWSKKVGNCSGKFIDHCKNVKL